MYEQKILAQFPFFHGLMERMNRSAFHDSLTGLIARPFIMEFIRSLLSEKTPFTLAMIDLDNFKNINDHYGHRVGDEVLSQTAESLRQYIGSSGLVGRFGGDEFLVVYLKSNQYDDLHDFYGGMFTPSEANPETIFRKHLIVHDAMPYVTATIGSASYPDNAQDFDSLFALMDKALYRGKTKGRNCFIIYVPAKHDHLDIRALISHSLYDTYRSMTAEFGAEGSAKDCLKRAFQAVRKNLGLSRLLWIDEAGNLLDLDSDTVLGRYPDAGKLMKDGMYAATNFFEMLEITPDLCQGLKALDMESALLIEVGPNGKNGYLVVCPEVRTMHIWQDAERATAFVLASLLNWHLEK